MAELIELNNMKIMHQHVESSISSVNIMFNVGSIHEEKGQIGMSHLLEHLVLCDKRINQIINKGANFNGSTEPHATSYYFSCPNDVFLELVTLFADIMVFKNFDYSKKLDKEKGVVIQEIKNCIVDPNCDLYLKLKRALYNNSLGFETVGLEEDINRITKKEIQSYFKKYYTKSSMVVSVVSDLDAGDVMNCIKHSALNKFPVGRKVHFTRRTKQHRAFKHISYPLQVEKAFFLFSVIFDKKDIYACKLLMRILCGNLNSRLFRKLRNRGYIYTIKSEVNIYTNSSAGMFMITSSCDFDKLNKCLDIIISECENMASSIKEPELRKTKVANRATLLVGLETSEKLCDFIGKQFMLGEEYNLDHHLEKFDSVTLDEIKAVAKKYFVKHKMVIVSNNKKGN